MICQQLLSIVFAIIGCISCASIANEDFVKFESALEKAKSGNEVSIIVNNPSNLHNFLNEMASKPANYTIPITDKYLLYRFYNGVLAHHNARVTEKEVLDEKIPVKEQRLTDLDKEIAVLEKAVKEQNSFIALFSSKKKNELEEQQKKRKNLSDELEKDKNRQKELFKIIPMYEKFNSRFNAEGERKRLLDTDKVKMGEAEENKRMEERRLKHKRNK